MVTLEEDVDGLRGLDWLYLCYGVLDLAVANLAGAYASLEQPVKGFQLLFRACIPQACIL